MPEHITFHLVFLGQILLVSFYLPKRVHDQMKYVFETYTPSTHPKLYPRPVEHYQRSIRTYRNWNLFMLSAGLLIFAALFINPHDGDVDNAIVMGYFFAQMFPVILLDISSLKEFRLMRTVNSRTTRTAELHPRRLFDFISPTLFGITVITYVAFVLLILYIKQFEFPWFGGYWNILGITIMNLFFASMVLWQMYGKKLNPHQAYADRIRSIETTTKIMVFTSIAATVFVALSVALSAFEIRHLLPVFLSLYCQSLAAIGFQAYRIGHTNFDVYKGDPLVT